MDLDDFLQEASLAVAEAAENYDPNRGASWKTYTIGNVIFHMRRMLEKQKQAFDIGSYEPVFVPDYFFVRVQDVFNSTGNNKAKLLLCALLENFDAMDRCSMAELKRVAMLSDKDFKMATAQLSRF